MKIIKKTVICISVLLCLGFSVNYLLSPSEKIDNSKRICNIDDNINIRDINRDVIKSIEINDKAIINMEINNTLFKKIIKYNLLKSGEIGLEASVVELENDYVNIISPYKIGFYNTVIEAHLKLSTNKKSLIFDVDSLKVGKLKLPDFIKDKFIKEFTNAKSKSKRIYSSNDKIYLNFGDTGVKIKNIEILNSILHIKFEIENKIPNFKGIEIIQSMFDY